MESVYVNQNVNYVPQLLWKKLWVWNLDIYQVGSPPCVCHADLASREVTKRLLRMQV